MNRCALASPPQPKSIARPSAWLLGAALASILGPGSARGAGAPPPPVEIPVLVITTYETGKDRGDVPGELQFWAERQHLDHEIKVPGVDHALLTNDHGLYAMVSGTSSRCAVQIMALAADPRFDLRHTYILLSGVAGGDAAMVPLGTAVWVDTVVDGDPAFEFDSRDIPASWPYGIVAFGATEPGKGSINVDAVPAAGTVDDGSGGGIGKVAFHLNTDLVHWAYAKSKDVQLPDDPAMRKLGRKFVDYPKAQLPAEILIGESMGVDRFYYGAGMTKWAADWVKLYTRGKGALYVVDCEDAGVCLAMQRLTMMGKVDEKRLLILRAACNYSVPSPGVTAPQGLFGTEVINDSAGAAVIPALEADYRVGSAVTSELLAHWSSYYSQTP